MRALSDVLTLDAWRDICETAINSARDGDAKAREWVARYALGDSPTTIHALAVMETHDLQPIDLVEAEAALDAEQANGDFDGINQIFGSRTRPDTLIGAIQSRAQDVAARQAKAARAERQAQQERRAAACAAAKAAQVVDARANLGPPGPLQPANTVVDHHQTRQDGPRRVLPPRSDRGQG